MPARETLGAPARRRPASGSTTMATDHPIVALLLIAAVAALTVAFAVVFANVDPASQPLDIHLH